MIVFAVLFMILFFALQLLVCCLAAGNDAYSQFLSDQEQMEYLAKWKKEHDYR